MKKLRWVFLGVGILVVILAFAKLPKPPFPHGKETTYVTGPLDADGYIDYVAAVNEHLRQGVTPANNANVLLWRAFGPHPERATMPEEFFTWLEIKPPPEQGDYFIPLSRYSREQDKQPPVRDANAIYDELSHCSQRLWKASEHESITAWLKANDKPLALAVEASKRSRYYLPLVPKRTEKGPAPLLDALLPSVQNCRELANALTARALLRLGEGRSDEAWQDLLACHRLGRLVAQGGTLIELLVGIAIDAIAGKSDLAFLEQSQCKSEQIEKCLSDLQKLPPLPAVADKVDFGERMMVLDIVQMIDRNGPEFLEHLSGSASSKESGFFAKLFQARIDWEPALLNINRWYDRITETMRKPDRDARETEMKQIEEELRELKQKNQPTITDSLYFLVAPNSARLRGEKIGNILIGLMAPALNKVQAAADRCEQMQYNLHLAFALAAYQRDRGRYPEELAALTPKYIDKIPIDLFSGKPLVYRPSANGYLLYSIGVNGRDDEGQGTEDDPQADDLSVRMPLPQAKPK